MSLPCTKCFCISSYIHVIYSPGSILEFLAFLQHLLGGDGGRYLTHNLSLAAAVEEAAVSCFFFLLLLQMLRVIISAFWALGFFEHPDFGVN